MGKIIDRVRQRQAEFEYRERRRRADDLNRDLMRTLHSHYGGASAPWGFVIFAAVVVIGVGVALLKGVM